MHPSSATPPPRPPAMWAISVLVIAITAFSVSLLADPVRGAPPIDVADSDRELQRRVSELQGEGRYDEALIAARELLRLRSDSAETPEWRRLGAQTLVASLEALAALEPDAVAEVRGALSSRSEWQQLDGTGLYTEAEVVAAESWSTLVDHLGEDHVYSVEFLHLIANMRQKEGRLAEAEAIGRRVVEKQRALMGEEHPRTLAALQNLGWLLASRGQFESGASILRRAIEIADRSLGSDHMVAIGARINLGLSLDRPEHHAAARDVLTEAVRLSRDRFGDEHGLTLNALDALARVEAALGQADSAEERLRTIEAISTRRFGADHPETLSRELTLASLLADGPRRDEARRRYEALLPRFDRVFGPSHPETVHLRGRLGALAYRLGDLPTATRSLGEAAHAFEVARLWINDSDLDRARFDAWISPLPHLAICHARAGDALTAWTWLEAAAGRGLRDAIARKTSRPLTRSEREREHAFSVELEQLEERLRTATDESERDEVTLLRAKLFADRVEWERQLAARYDRAPANSVAPPADATPLRHSLSENTAFVTWAEAPDGRPWGFVLPRSGEPIAMALPGSGPDGAWSARDRHALDRLRTALASSPISTTDRGIRLVRRGAVDLGKIESLRAPVVARYWTPLAARLPERIEHLVVLPSPPLCGVPLSVIATDHRVSYAPSATLYQTLMQRPKVLRGGRPWLALGDPASEGIEPSPWVASIERSAHVGADPRTPLPFARFEVAALERIRHGESETTEPSPTPDAIGGVESRVGDQATEAYLESLRESAQLGQLDLLHFATHAVVDDGHPMRSAILLSSTEDSHGTDASRDGRITAEQIRRTWQLDAELVTLSACRTGVGAESGNEGFLGFSQALFLAGARSSILTLWKVDDRATALFMTRFYANWYRRGQSKVDALHEAAAWLRSLTQDEVDSALASPAAAVAAALDEPRNPASSTSERPFAHPYYWAAFVLVGDPR